MVVFGPSASLPLSRSPLKRNSALALALLWTLGIIAALLLPFQVVEGLVERVGQHLGHLILFTGSTWLWLRAFPRSPLTVVLAMVALALGTEVLQMVFASLGRGAQLGDLVADGAGIAAGFVFWTVMRRWVKQE